MPQYTKDLSIRVESDDGEVLLDERVTVNYGRDAPSPGRRYGEGRFGEEGYGG